MSPIWSWEGDWDEWETEGSNKGVVKWRDWSKKVKEYGDIEYWGDHIRTEPQADIIQGEADCVWGREDTSDSQKPVAIAAHIKPNTVTSGYSLTRRFKWKRNSAPTITPINKNINARKGWITSVQNHTSRTTRSLLQ